MHPSDQPRETGSYTANLLGIIRNYLEDPPGHDIMALELIQNADDARAKTIVFDITNAGLWVRNSGVFTYCRDLNSSRCGSLANEGYVCDYHRIVDVSSGGKLLQEENIGRFGIGFLSTYQITDNPEIRSAGIKLTLDPATGTWSSEQCDDPRTTFFLPWAKDRNLAARVGPPITEELIDQLACNFQLVLRQSLLFLRHVRKAEVRRDGELLIGCDLDRSDGSNLKVSFHPSGKVEHWHILRADVAEAAWKLVSKYPVLAQPKRRTEVGIGLPVSPGLLPKDKGRLYAFLPTEKKSGLPLHINADFFPSPDRKLVIFEGHQHQREWNEMLVKAAAERIAHDLKTLLKVIGHVQLWEILYAAKELDANPHGWPACYKQFWKSLRATATEARIVPAQAGPVRRPREVFVPVTVRRPREDFVPVTFYDKALLLTDVQAKALLQAKGSIAIKGLLHAKGSIAVEDLRPFQAVMKELGAKTLTLRSLIEWLEYRLGSKITTQVNKAKLKSLYRPLLGIVNNLLPPNFDNPRGTFEGRHLQDLPFLVTEDLVAVSINVSCVAPPSLDLTRLKRIAGLFPELHVFASNHFSRFPALNKQIPILDLSILMHDRYCNSWTLDQDLNADIDPESLRDLYTLFADLYGLHAADKKAYNILRYNPIWRSSRGNLISAYKALLPGNFTDPTGQANLLDTSVLSESARKFVTSKLGVRKQTIEAYVVTMLPTLFNDDGPLDETKYQSLITELAKHPTLISEEGTRKNLRFNLRVPTQDGKWSKPTDTYYRSDALVKALGDEKHLWLDDSRLPNTPSVSRFMAGVVIRQSATAQHLVKRILDIANRFPPTEKAKQKHSDAFHVLCEKYEAWKKEEAFQDAIYELNHCLPAEDDSENWHSPESLYAPDQADAFRSQAQFLDFRHPARLKTDLLKDLGVSITPPTELVIKHLKHCMEQGTGPHLSTYQLLNERAQGKDSQRVSALAGTKCIYVESLGKFVRTNQVYWVAQQLGGYAFSIPKSEYYDSLKPLFTAIGVKEKPECSDYIQIVLALVNSHDERSEPIRDADRAIYDRCLKNVAAAHGRDECDPSDLSRLQQAPTIVNLADMPTCPHKILLQDSEWHAGFFDGELDRALCKLPAELFPLAEDLGVRRLSKCARVKLEEDSLNDGEKQDETSLAEDLRERSDIIARWLHDETPERGKIRDALAKLEAYSYDVVRIQASARFGDDDDPGSVPPVLTPPIRAKAFYDIERGRLLLSRPSGDHLADILKAVFHQLMPGTPGTEISRLACGVRPLLKMDVQDAHDELTVFGVLQLDPGHGIANTDDLASQELDELGSGHEPGGRQQIDEPVSTGKDSESVASQELDELGSGDEPGGRQQIDEPVSTGEDSESGANAWGNGGGRPKMEHQRAHDEEVSGGAAPSRDLEPRRPTENKAQPKHKEQEDRPLYSLAQRESSESENSGASMSEHNLEVEKVARKAVCAYERARGRIAKQKDQKHPGYDILSNDPHTGKDRLIEVKGVAGEWNQTGVRLSSRQFEDALENGNRYWLYVVEFAFGSREASYACHPKIPRGRSPHSYLMAIGARRRPTSTRIRRCGSSRAPASIT